MFPETRALLLLAGLSIAGAASAQKQNAPVRPPTPTDTPTTQTAHTQVSLDELLGAEVRFEPSPAEKPGTGREREDERADRSRDDRAKGDQAQGRFKDLVLATRDGQIACAALSVGGTLGTEARVVLVPVTAVRCTMNEKKPCCLLRMTKAEVEALPEFDLEKSKEGLDRAVERARELATEPGGRKDSYIGRAQGPGGSREAASPAPSGTSSSTYALASELKGSALNAGDKEFGRVKDATVDVGGNTLGYLLVSHGGVAGAGDQVLVIPFRACRWTRDEDTSFLKIFQTADQLRSAPEYEKPDQGVLTAEQMRMADSFFATTESGVPISQ